MNTSILLLSCLLSIGIQTTTIASPLIPAIHLPENALDLCDYPPEKPCDPEPPCKEPVIDLLKFTDDFILETLELTFPEFPGAFNPSLVRWNGGILLSFRIYKPITCSTNPFVIVALDEDFRPIGHPQIFELPFYNPIFPSKQQDPRLITVGERLFVVYNNLSPTNLFREVRRMYISELKFDGVRFHATEPSIMTEFPECDENRQEKNWTPFAYKDRLHLIYSATPHTILRPHLRQNYCDLVASSLQNIHWPWGAVRGGSQAELVRGQYLTFFHSQTNIRSKQSNGKLMSHWLMGAYTFQKEPPFAITAISPHPLVTESFYAPPFYKTWKPMRCIFPGGFIVDKHHIWVACGRQDHEIVLVKMNKDKLLDSLVPVQEAAE